MTESLAKNHHEIDANNNKSSTLLNPEEISKVGGGSAISDIAAAQLSVAQNNLQTTAATANTNSTKTV